MNDEKNTPIQEQHEAGEHISDADNEVLMKPTRQELFKMILGGYLGMLPAFIAMVATFVIILLIVIFVWGG